MGVNFYLSNNWLCFEFRCLRSITTLSVRVMYGSEVIHMTKGDGSNTIEHTSMGIKLFPDADARRQFFHFDSTIVSQMSEDLRCFR